MIRRVQDRATLPGTVRAFERERAYRSRSRRGILVVVLAIVMLSLLGIAALVIDLSRAMLIRRQMQAAVAPAALETLRSGDASLGQQALYAPDRQQSLMHVPNVTVTPNPNSFPPYEQTIQTPSATGDLPTFTTSQPAANESQVDARATVPLLFAVGVKDMNSGEPLQAKVRATSIAAPQPVLSVGAKQDGMEWLTNFTLTEDFWRSGWTSASVTDTAAQGALQWVAPDASMVYVVGMLAPTSASSTVAATGLAPIVRNVNRADHSGQDLRIVGFAHLDVSGDTMTRSTLKIATANVSATFVSTSHLSQVDMDDLFQPTALPLVSPGTGPQLLCAAALVRSFSLPPPPTFVQQH